MMRCTKCNGLDVRRWDVEFQQEEVVCINCGAMPLQKVIPEPPPHGLVKARRGLADDPFRSKKGKAARREKVA